MTLVSKKAYVVLISMFIVSLFAIFSPVSQGQEPQAADQEDEELKVLEAQQAQAAMEEIIPSYPGEELDTQAPQADPAALIEKAIERLGGRSSFEALKDLRFAFEHKNYLRGERLYFVEKASAYVRPARFPEVRMDFENYAMPADLTSFLDYRELIGADGPFKYMEGKVLRGPVVIRESGERLTRLYLQLFNPFCLDPSKCTPRYLGVSRWKEKKDGKETTVACHKILVGYDEPKAWIRGNVLALYIDTDSNELRRYVYEPLLAGAGIVKRIRILDILERGENEGLRLPTELLITDIWDGRLNATHKIRFLNMETNTGLEGVGFDMVSQKPGKPESLNK